MDVFRKVRIYDRRTKSHVMVRVDLAIDVDELARVLGEKAWHNKSRRSKLQVGVKAEAAEART